MNKKNCIVLLVAVFTASYAQAQFTFGVRAGINLTDVVQKFDSYKQTFGFKPGFQIGVVGESAISEQFAIQPAILFSTQGAHNKAFDYVVNFNCLQIPINAQYKLNLGSLKLLFQAGPYLVYALNGKLKYDNGEKSDIKFGSGEDENRRLDLGIGAGAGIQFESIQACVGYNHGFVNIWNSTFSSMNHYGFALTLTYLFAK